MLLEAPLYNTVYDAFVSGMSGHLMPAYGFSWPAIAVFTAFAGAVFICSAVLVCFCLIRGKPQPNRFDRGAESIGFSFRRRQV